MTKFKNFLGNLGYSGLIIMLACGLTTLKIWQLDGDTWFLLNCGRYVVETGTIPHEEFASIHGGLHYVMQQWLTAIIFWKIYSNFGADGLIIFAWIVGFILTFVYYRMCLFVSGGNKTISVMLSMIICGIISSHFIVTRPWILSTLLLLIEIFLLEKYFAERKIWTLCALPILSAIFINIHAAMWVMMIIVLLPYIAESLILNFKNISTPFLPLIFAALGIFLAGFLNPYGWESMTYVFRSTDPSIRQLIIEMRPLTADSIAATFFYIFSALLIVAFSKKSLPIRYFFLTFGIMFMGFYSLRNLFIFFVLATFPLALAAKNLHFDNFFILRPKLFIPLYLLCIPEIFFVCYRGQQSIYEINLPMKILFAFTIFFLICFIFFYRKEGKLFSQEIFILRRKPLIALVSLQLIIFFAISYYSIPVRKYEPYKPAVEFLLSKNRAEDIILWTGYNSGGYFEFYKIKCYIDPRAETFLLSNNQKDDIFQEYKDLFSGDLDYREFFSRYNFTHIFVTKDDLILYLMLSNDENYKLLFEYDFPDGKGHGRIFIPKKK